MQITGQQPKSVKETKERNKTNEKATKVVDLVCAWENKRVHTFYRKYRKKKEGGNQQESATDNELRSAMQIAGQQPKSAKQSTTKERKKHNK